ncbi:MAG: ANTAR domain-containing protein [Alphaproteobacteria bacterium]|nr:ANTAR domain-containing protein [Alphaproteobacteria bacterium]
MALRVLLVDQEPDRASTLERVLRDAGYDLLGKVAPDTELVGQVRRLGPDVIIVDMALPDRDTLEYMATLTRDQPKPIVMFVDQSDETMIGRAVKAGVSAYVVDGVDPQRVKPIVDVAIAQFREFQALRDELAQTKSNLAGRKLIDRAKGLLMAERDLSEEDAYRALRKLAMDRGMRLSDVAEEVLALAKLPQR